MPALVLVLLALAFGYIALTKGPMLLAALVATGTVVLYRRLATRTDDRLFAMQDASLRRTRDGRGWDKVPAEQALLARSLKLALKQTELFNQYPESAQRGSRLASQFGLA